MFESASGYGLFEIVEAEEISALKAEVQASVTDLSRFSKIVKLKAFQVRRTLWVFLLLCDMFFPAVLFNKTVN